jgi:hypothetical protein
MYFKIIAIAMAAAEVVLLLIQNASSWARSLQRYYVSQSVRWYGDSGGWGQRWTLTLFKVIIVFFGLMAILGIYVAVFSAA